jgi:hypothetical protein
MSGEQRLGANRPCRHIAEPAAYRREGNAPVQRPARDGPERIDSSQSIEYQQMILIPHRLSLPSQGYRPEDHLSGLPAAEISIQFVESVNLLSMHR